MVDQKFVMRENFLSDVSSSMGPSNGEKSTECIIDQNLGAAINYTRIDIDAEWNHFMSNL